MYISFIIPSFDEGDFNDLDDDVPDELEPVEVWLVCYYHFLVKRIKEGTNLIVINHPQRNEA